MVQLVLVLLVHQLQGRLNKMELDKTLKILKLKGKVVEPSLNDGEIMLFPYFYEINEKGFITKR